jgi:MFS transporter, DHA1 family, tetracycline resistance protein
MKRSPLAIIFLTVFIDLVGFGIVLPLLPYYVETYGASAATIGMLQASYSLMQFLFTPIWGRLSDRYGRRPLILVSLAGSCIGFLIFGLAGSLPALFLGRMVAGIAGAIIPTTNAYVADVTPPEGRAKGMGLVGAAFGLGFILGPAIGGILAPYGYNKPVLLASLMAAINFVFAFFKLPESLPESARSQAQRRPFGFQALRDALTHPQILPLMLMYLVVIFAFSNMEATFGLLNEHRYGLTARQTGYLFAFIGIVMSIIQGLLVGRLVRRMGERRLIILGSFTMIFGLALMPFTPSTLVYCVVLAVLSFGAGINNPSITALLSKSSQADEQGGIMGIAQSVASLGRILGPLWGGYAFDAFGIGSPFITGGMFMAVAFLISILRLRNPA